MAFGSEGPAKAREALAATLGGDATLSLIGASGDVDFEGVPEASSVSSLGGDYVAIRAGTSEFFCRAPTRRQYCESRVTISSSGVLSGVSECPCPGIP